MRVVAAAIVASALISSRVTLADDEPLNVLVLLVDDLGWTDLGCFGSDLYETPNIDNLAATGMRFTNAYSACTVCSPTRAALLTGQYPARLHVTDFIPGHPIENTPLLIPDWTQQLNHEHVTIAEVLREQGYGTAHIGKWHLTPRIRTDNPNSDGGFPEFYPTTQGFDVNIGGNEAGAPRSYFWPYGRGRGEARRDNNIFHTLPPGGEEGEYLTDRLTDEALKRLRKAADGDEPFFMYFAYYTVHTPLQAKMDDVRRYQAKIANAASELRHHNATYAAMVGSLDQSVGRVLDLLDETGLDERTLVIFTSDNGGLIDAGDNAVTSNLPLRNGKGSVYEGGVRVPAIIRWPGVTRPGSVSDAPIISVDYLPTILAATGVEAPDEVAAVLDGVSLAPVLASEDVAAPERMLFWHYPHYHMMGGIPYSSVRVGQWKLIHFHDGRTPELYHLGDDVHEDRNRAGSDPEVLARLQGRLDHWRTEVGAQMPTRNPAFDPTIPIGWTRNGTVREMKPYRRE
jgi:arylsulfatase A-like enzyme